MCEFIERSLDIDVLPEYQSIFESQLIKSKKFAIYDYGISNCYWSVYDTTNKSPFLKYSSITNHESSTFTCDKVKDLAKIQRKTLKGDPPKYEVDLNMGNSFNTFADIRLHLDPQPTLQYSDIDGVHHKLIIISTGSVIKRLKLVREEDQGNVLANFTFSPLVPFKPTNQTLGSSI